MTKTASDSRRAPSILTALAAALLFGSAPFIGSLIAFVAVREAVTAQFLAALPIMIGAAALLITEQHTHEHQHALFVHEHHHRHDDTHHAYSHGAVGVRSGQWHSHEHAHEAQHHAHSHAPDLHQRHEHGA